MSKSFSVEAVKMYIKVKDDKYILPLKGLINQKPHTILN